MRVLGIETSCDETAAAVVEDGYKLLSNVVASSMDIHAKYGGVIPEIAARSHIEAINPVIADALKQANCTWDDIDGIAVTYGAGLGGCLLIGVLAARTLAILHDKPLYACNHVEGHVYANFLTETPFEGYSLPSKQPDFPLLALIVSGGHSQLVLFRDHFDYTLLGRTQDDAIGEAFDKVAKILGLPYPGGPSIEKKAKEGNPHAFEFPKAKVTSVSPALVKLRSEMREARSFGSDGVHGSQEKRTSRTDGTVSEASTQLTQQSAENNSEVTSSAGQQAFVVNASGYDYSFSGPKTAVLRTAQKLIGESHDFPSFKLSERLSEAQKADIAASFQRVAVETVVDKTMQAYEEFKPKSVVIAGGVAASPELRRQLKDRLPIEINYTDPKLCTDNGAMIATLACFKIQKNQSTADPYKLDIQPNLSM